MDRLTLNDQPNDHLNLILGMLEWVDLCRLLRTSTRLARFAKPHMSKASQRLDDQLENELINLKAAPGRFAAETQGLLESIRPGTAVVRLDRRGQCKVKQVHDSQLDLISRRCGPLLRTLTVRGSWEGCGVCLSDQYVIKLFSRCPNLTELTLADCITFTHEPIEAIPSLRGLTSLDLGWTNVTNQNLLSIGLHCHNLRKLTIAGCREIIPQGDEPDGIECITLGCRQLEWFNANRAPISGESIQALARNCPMLSLLKVGCYRSFLTDDTIETIVKRCPRLSVLDVSFHVDLSSQAMQLIADHCHELTHLSLRRCLGIRDVIPVIGCRKLTWLDLEHLYLGVDPTEQLIKSRLVSLSLSSTFFHNRREGIERIATGCSTLKHLVIDRPCEPTMQALLERLQQIPGLRTVADPFIFDDSAFDWFERMRNPESMTWDGSDDWDSLFPPG